MKRNVELITSAAALDKVKVDLTKVFEKGQGEILCETNCYESNQRPSSAYVALSRATSLQGLHVVGFKPDKVRYTVDLDVNRC